MPITVTVSPLESHFNGSHDGSPRQTQRFSFCMFVQEELFMPSSEASEKVSSVIVGIEMNGYHTQITSLMEPIVITFIVPKVKIIAIE